jgi:hypothetical protein
MRARNILASSLSFSFAPLDFDRRGLMSKA